MEIGITVDVLFDLAHFRVHTTMKSRTSYLIPLPTTVIGFFFSILGKARDEYIKERK
ncbi:MAG TPA: CRISPR-associated protein Cas5, partial [Archaeoglobus profundus]|nr:CRISPR-associated protein Cas5 [Archaeoglobus profundus]